MPSRQTPRLFSWEGKKVTTAQATEPPVQIQAMEPPRPPRNPLMELLKAPPNPPMVEMEVEKEKEADFLEA